MTFISSGHNPDHTTSVRRKKGDRSIVHVECPECIADYMGGVDKGDQYREVRMKSRKSYKYIFWFMFEVCVLNSFILSFHPISSFLAYRQQLSRELIGPYNSRKRQVISRATIHRDLVVSTQHFPSKATKHT